MALDVSYIALYTGTIYLVHTCTPCNKVKRSIRQQTHGAETQTHSRCDMEFIPPFYHIILYLTSCISCSGHRVMETIKMESRLVVPRKPLNRIIKENREEFKRSRIVIYFFNRSFRKCRQLTLSSLPGPLLSNH